MQHFTISLKDCFPDLNGAEPTLTAYLQSDMGEMAWPEQKRPCLIICPGGAYAMCSDREAEPVAMHFLPEGYHVFVLRYSVAPHRFPCQLREVAAAIELIYQNAEVWHCDTGRIALMGFSAGGHLAAHYATCYDIAPVREAFPDSKPVQASLLCYPVISADPEIAHMGSFQNLFGTEKLSQSQAQLASCELQVSDRTPPAFLWHTAADPAVPVANSLRYAMAMSAHNRPVCVHIYPFGTHGLATVDGQTCANLSAADAYANDWLTQAKKWLKLTLS